MEQLKELTRRMMHHYPLVRGRSRFTWNLSELFPLQPDTNVPFDGDLTIELSEKQFVSRQIFWFGVFEPREASFVKDFVKPGMVVIDVGGNIGQYTLLAAKRVGPSGEVHTFEPSPENYAILKRNIKRNGFTDRVVLNRTALSSERKQAKLILTPDGGSNWISTNDASSSHPNECTEEEIQCETLDAYVAEKHLHKIDFIKIDAEGSDFEILKGAVNTLDQFSPALLLEFAERMLKKYGATCDQMLNFLRAHRYTPFEITSSRTRPLR